MAHSNAAFVLVLLAATAQAEPAGPPAPGSPRRSPAKQAIALYAAGQAETPQAAGCPPSRRGEIVVCGADRSPYRLPLPAERGAAAGARIATGDRDMVVDPGSPMPGPRGIGLQLKVPLGKAATPAAPALHGLGGDR